LPSSTDLLDANVWLALAAEAHAHHGRAKSYWETEAAPVSAFCRVTQLEFLRHLTNKAIMNTSLCFRPSRDFRASRTLIPAMNCRAILFRPAGWERAIPLNTAGVDSCGAGTARPQSLEAQELGTSRSHPAQEWPLT
jgi:hypothetical protein